MSFDDQIKALSQRVPNLKDHLKTEEATKNALVMPFIKALGYQAMEVGFSTAPEWIRELGFGAGMGLNNIRKFVDEMHLESTVGVGSRLEILIWLNSKGHPSNASHGNSLR